MFNTNNDSISRFQTCILFPRVQSGILNTQANFYFKVNKFYKQVTVQTFSHSQKMPESY